MAIDKFINFADGRTISKISDPRAPVEANFLDDNGRLRLKSRSYYFSGDKRMQFDALQTITGAFTFGIAFAPTTQFSLGKILLAESTDGYIEFGKSQTQYGVVNIKIDGKIAKNATLDFEYTGKTPYQTKKFIPNELNVIFVQRTAANQLQIRGENGDLISVITADTNTLGTINFDRLGGNTLEGFEGYIGEIYLEQRYLSQMEMRRISKIWFDKFVELDRYET
jgi:hypothetical protein